MFSLAKRKKLDPFFCSVFDAPDDIPFGREDTARTFSVARQGGRRWIEDWELLREEGAS